ncbi:hypothetical protein LDENG_00159380 [Lucifuga dentata]|nr:hypothetical protein LDENG_00159380 [Lucifuga dentata]
MLWRVDCVDVGLSAVPSNLSGFASFLDLSMNELWTLPAHAFTSLHALQELILKSVANGSSQLAGNSLTDISKDAFAGLMELKVLTLQNNQLKQSHVWRLDANFIARLPAASFRGLASLHHLWLDDNVLAEVPARALSGVPALQALTLALNNISHVPDRALASLTQLVVLHLHDNQIHTLGQRCFDGLHSLETLDLSSNRLNSFPAAIRSLSNLREINLQNNNISAVPEHAFTRNPSLEIINIRNNPLHAVGQSSFQLLPELQTLFLSGTSSITTFPDFTGTNGLQTLSVTGSHISVVPGTVCEELPNLQSLDLSHNLIQILPNFSRCKKLQNVNLRHNYIRVIPSGTFRQMKELRSLDLSFNRLSSISLDGLQSLAHLKLTGNLQLRASLPLHLHPRFRVAELPFAFQRCTFLHCIQAANSASDIRSSGPDVFAPWLLRFSIWFIFILSIIFNFLVLVSIFLSSTSKPPTPSQCSTLDVVHADCFSVFHPRTESEAGSGLASFLFALSSEACVFLMMAIVFERQNWPKFWWSSLGGVQVTSVACFGLALAVTVLPLLVFGEVSFLSPCSIVSFHRHLMCSGYSTALVAFNAFCFLSVTITHMTRQKNVRLNPTTAHDNITKTMTTFLLLTNTLLFLSTTLLSFSSLLHFPEPEISNTVVLLLTSLPVCLDPLVYMLLSPNFRAELCCLGDIIQAENTTKHEEF